jgi:predicted amidohydrolase YtcJ
MHHPAEQVLVNCAVYDVVTGAARPDRAVWVDGEGMIRAVGPVDDVLAEAGDITIVDLGGGYVMPGLTNMHVHLALGLPGHYGDEVHRSNHAELVLLMADSARGGGGGGGGAKGGGGGGGWGGGGGGAAM